MKIRQATPEDAEELLRIYGYYVKNTAITLEWEIPSVREFSKRISDTLEKYPYIVIETDEKIIGYAYARPLNTRQSYHISCEASVYVDKDLKKRGCGRMLYEALFRKLLEMKVENVYACIASPIIEDEYLTNNSENFHAHMGFAKIAEFHKCAEKFGRYYNMIWMEKFIAEKNKYE